MDWCVTAGVPVKLSERRAQTEPEAREKYGDENVKTYTSKFGALYYVRYMPTPYASHSLTPAQSFFPQEEKAPTAYKLVCQGKDDRVVGVHIIGMGSDEIMQGFAVAVKMGARKQDLVRRSASRGVVQLLTR